MTPYEAQWLEQHGKVVTLNGEQHTLRVRCYEAMYPYKRTVLYVAADPCNKTSAYYLETKQTLQDEWSVDILGSDEAAVASVMRQVSWQFDR